jgi:outer membrane protein TolC
VQLAEFRQQEIEAEGDAAVARAALATLLQRSATEEIAVDGAMPERTFADVDVQQAIARGLTTRGDVAIAKASARNAELDLRTARGALLPRLDALANWSTTGSTLRGRNPDHTLAVMASFDLFDGGKLARVAEARAGVEEARAAESAARDAVTMEIVGAYHRARAARQRVGVAAKAVEQAEAATRIVRDRYEHGLTTITEQLRAETALVRARLGLLAARYDYVVGHAELLRATGELNNADEF